MESQQEKKQPTPMDARFEKIKSSIRDSSANCYEVMCLLADTSIKNTRTKSGLIVLFQRLIYRFGQYSDRIKKHKEETHEYWQLYVRVVQLRDLTKQVFHGSVLNDILQQNYFTELFIDALDAFGINIGFKKDLFEEDLS